MSRRTERRETERAARKLAYQKSRQQPPAATLIAEAVQTAESAPETIASDLLARAQAFFERPTSDSTQAQIQANRANALLSTGPITAEGKAISSRNNTRHGLTGDPEAESFKVLPTENQNTYNQTLADFRKEWQPATATEHDIVNRLVMHKWLRQRALRLQESLFSTTTGELTDVKKFDLYRRYETAHERGYNRAFADLLRLRAFHLRQRNGFESQQRKNTEHEFKMQRLKRQDELKQATRTAKTNHETHQTLQKAA